MMMILTMVMTVTGITRTRKTKDKNKQKRRDSSSSSSSIGNSRKDLLRMLKKVSKSKKEKGEGMDEKEKRGGPRAPEEAETIVFPKCPQPENDRNWRLRVWLFIPFLGNQFRCLRETDITTPEGNWVDDTVVLELPPSLMISLRIYGSTCGKLHELVPLTRHQRQPVLWDFVSTPSCQQVWQQVP